MVIGKLLEILFRIQTKFVINALMSTLGIKLDIIFRIEIMTFRIRLICYTIVLAYILIVILSNGSPLYSIQS